MPIAATAKLRDGAGGDPFARLPRPIVAKLEALVRRVRGVALLKGLFAVLATASGAAVAIMLIDASFTILDDRLRSALSAVALAAVLATAYRQIWRPLRRRIGLAEIARAVEGRHPELEERISTAVELLASDDPEELRGSEQLISEVVKAASLDVKGVHPEREFSGRRAREPMLAAAAAVVLIAAAALAWPGATGKLLTRAFAPFIQTGNAYSDRLDVQPGDVAVAEGGTLTVEVELGGDGGRAEFRRRTGGGPDAVERMTYIEPVSGDEVPKFSLTIPAVSESFAYRIRSGRALSRYYQVEVVPRPRVLEYHVRYQFPAYTRAEPLTEVSPGGEIAAVVGTTVRLGAKLDRPVKNATLYVDGAPIWANEQSQLDGKPLYTWEFPIAAGLDGTWQVQLEDAAGIEGRPGEFAVRAVADRPPTVRISSPSTAELTVKPTEVVPIAFAASEDYGFTECQLLVTAPDRELPPIGIAPPAPAGDEPGFWTGQDVLDLRDLDLRGARAIEVRVRVADSLPGAAGGPGEATSEPVTLVLDRGAKSLLEQTLAGQQAEVQGALWEAMEKLLAARDLAEDKPGALLGDGPIGSEILLEIQEAGNLTGEAEAKVRQTAEAVAATLFADLAAPLAALASGHIEPARAAAETIPLTDRAVGRVFQARTMVRELEESIAELQTVLRELKRQAERARMTAELGNIEDHKRQLADLMGRLTDGDLRDNLQEQIDELDEMAGDLMRRSAESLADQFEDAGDIAAELAERAAELGEDQNKLAELLAQVDDPERRSELVDDLIQWLESEQRAIARDCAALRDHVGPEPDLDRGLDSASKRGAGAADLLTQNLLAEAADVARDNATALAGMRSTTPKVPAELQHLAGWQRSIAQQIAALGAGNLDDALAEMQEELAEQAAELAEQAEQFGQDARELADAEAAQRATQAAEQIAGAAQAAAQANSQLGGQSGGSFQFAENPGNFAPGENTPPGPPPPTQAGGGNASDTMLFGENTRFQRFEPPPDVSNLDGTAGTPFEIGEVALDHVPPALRNTERPQGGDLPPGYLPPIADTGSGGGGGQTSGRSSGAGGASGSGAAAGAGLGSAAGSLAGASDSLSSQANTPMAQHQPEPITPETAQQRMEELAAQIAEQETPRADAPSDPAWARVGGQVKSGVATGSRGQPPAEYRDLVKEYFEEIARRSNAPAAEQP